MTCYHPVQAWRIAGQSALVFMPPRRGNVLESLQVPCSYCIGCRVRKSIEWATRCTHEAQLHRQNSFITLTYDPAYLPADGSLHLDHQQKFFKRLRKHYEDSHRIRFFACGEYGEKNMRPHYHALLFGHSFEDMKLWKIERGFNLYRSTILERLWPFGHSLIGAVTFESSAYVARYNMKKVYGSKALQHYTKWDDNGVITQDLKPEYVTMSRRPGIGHAWIEKYYGDVYPYDHVVFRGNRTVKPPQYYDRWLQANSDRLELDFDIDEIKFARFKASIRTLDDSSEARLNVREAVKASQLRRLVRNL